MSLYDTETWANDTNYLKNDVVYGGEDFPRYYYALHDHTSNSTGEIDVDITAGHWDGIIFTQNVYYPHFFWLPSYGLTVRQQPRVKLIKFGDGYEQRIPDGINTTLLEVDYTFENRNLQETHAILHFLNTREGRISFLHTPIAPSCHFSSH